MEHTKQNCQALAKAVVMTWNVEALREHASEELAESYANNQENFDVTVESIGFDLDKIMEVSMDGGVTWTLVKEGVRVVYRNLFIPGEDARGELQVNCTFEGIIEDVWVEKRDGYPNIAHSSRTVDEVVSQMVEDDA
jgi:formate-dependent phosphoribosylglycinamide formyltransferase (GAR transformylase)